MNEIKTNRTEDLLYKHLDPKTIPILEGTLKEKLKWLQMDHFVYYPKAKQCIDELTWIFEQTINRIEEGDFIYDLEGLTLIGDPGVGKSSIINEIKRIHSEEKHNPSYETYQVAHCMLKASITGLKGLYSANLEALGHPYGNLGMVKRERISVDELENVLIYTLKNIGVKLMFIDEFQHAKGRYQQDILNQLKRTMLVSQVPFIPVGTPIVEEILKLDTQLADRCPVRPFSRLEMWTLNKEFQKFLAGYERFLPFPEPSNLGSKDMAEKIFDKVKKTEGTYKDKTNLRMTVRFLRRVSKTGLIRKLDHITDEIILKEGIITDNESE